jgi:hypothetical protein
MQRVGEEFEKSKLLAAQLARWDNRITQIAAVGDNSENTNSVELVCSFEPEPDSDEVGFFWIVNLLTRIEFERLDERLAVPFAYGLGFKIGEQVFLPNREILKEPQNYTVLWPENEEG